MKPCDAQRRKALPEKSFPHLLCKSNWCLANDKDLYLSPGQKILLQSEHVNVDTRQKPLGSDSLDSEQIRALVPSSLGCSTQKGYLSQPDSRLLP